MNITRWDPFREMDEMAHRLNRMFGRSTLARDGETLSMPDWAPSVDIAETAEEFQIRAELPGVDKKNVSVKVENGALLITGERKQEQEEKGKRYHRIESSYGSFMRSFTLPDNVDPEHLAADFKDGILNVHLPKNGEAKPRTFDVPVK